MKIISAITLIFVLSVVAVNEFTEAMYSPELLVGDSLEQERVKFFNAGGIDEVVRQVKRDSIPGFVRVYEMLTRERYLYSGVSLGYFDLEQYHRFLDPLFSRECFFLGVGLGESGRELLVKYCFYSEIEFDVIGIGYGTE